MDNINQIDVLKSFFSPKERNRLTLPRAKGNLVSPGAVDWQQLEQATRHAWGWILVELISIARNGDRHEFLRDLQEQVRPSISSLRDHRLKRCWTLSRSRATSFKMRGKEWSWQSLMIGTTISCGTLSTNTIHVLTVSMKHAVSTRGRHGTATLKVTLTGTKSDKSFGRIETSPLVNMV
jgi:hypothetical protein